MPSGHRHLSANRQPRMANTELTNAMTVDVEDYFQVSAFESRIERAQWDDISPRVERNTDSILQLFSDHDVRATFFVLGWVAERFPDLLKRIGQGGHEIASHGYSHVRATTQEPREFREDVSRTKQLLEDLTGQEVKGFRAASFSIGADNLWATEILADVGYRYSSSVYPVRHDLYGMPDAPRFPFRHAGSNLLEIPISTVALGSMNLPCGGGGYFRLLPYRYFHWALARLNSIERQPAIFYFHPWEIDERQPRLSDLSFKTRLRHYVNLGKTKGRLTRLLKAFAWNRLDDIFLDGASPRVEPVHVGEAR